MGLITITSILGGLTCTQAYIIRNSSSTSVQRPPPSPRLISLSEDAAFDDPRVWHRALNDAPASNPPFANSTSPRSSVADSFGNLTIKTSIAPGATIQIPPPLGSNTPHTTGTVYTELDVKGKATQAPLLSQHISSPSRILTATGTATSVAASSPPLRTMVSNDIFAEPIDTKAPPSNIAVRQDHPVPRKGIQTKAPLQTNKFYSNFFLGDQLGPTYTFPYSVQWAGGKGASSSWGMSCSHIDAHQRVFGQEKFNGAVSYYLNPVGIQSMVISAKELGNGTHLSLDSITAFSARVGLSKDSKSPPAVLFPLVQGMAYITAQFDGALPLLQTGVYFKTMSRITREPKEQVTLRLDRDVLRWFRAQGRGYQTRINAVLRSYYLHERRKGS